MNLQSIILTRGLPAAGKTTWAKAWVNEDPVSRARVNRDDLRAMLFEHPTYEWHQEQAVTEVQRTAVKALLTTGRDVVCDDTNLRPKYIREWQRFAHGNGADVVIREFPVDVDEAIKRDAERDRSVGEDVIRRMVGKYLRKGEFLPILSDTSEDVPGERYTAPQDAEDAVIVDIDGTLAHKSDRDIYDLSRVHEDTPHLPVVEAVEAARRSGCRIIFCSGRDESARAATEAWLEDHADRTKDEPLFMRPAGDRRRDSIVKRELFDTHIRHRYDVRYVLDDRNQVVQMWRELGLTCFQVAEGDF